VPYHMNTINRFTRYLSNVTMTIVLILALSNYTHAEQQKDPYSIDILDLHLGLKQDEVSKIVEAKLNNAPIQFNRGTLSMGTFITEPLTFGAKVISATADEQISLTYSLKSNELVHIHRYKTFFGIEAAPTMDTLYASIIEKYGNSLCEATLPFHVKGKIMFWTYGSNFKSNAERGTTHCKEEIFIHDAETFNERISVGNLLVPSVSCTPSSCGAWMRVQMFPREDNDQVANILDISIGDLNALEESYLFIMDVLKKGAANSAAAEKAKAAANIPKL
jgi:hypothetical protein